MPRIRNQTLTYTRDAFREDISAIFASVQSGQDSLTVSEFRQTFEALTSKQFPSAASLGFSTDHEMFDHVRDICRVDFSSGYVRLVKCQNDGSSSLANSAPGNQRSRNSTISLSSDDDVQVMSPPGIQQQTRPPGFYQMGSSNLAGLNFPASNLGSFNGENQAYQQRASYQKIPAAYFANQSRGMMFPNTTDVRASQLQQFHALPRTAQQETMMPTVPGQYSNSPSSSNPLPTEQNPISRAPMQTTAMENRQINAQSTNGVEQNKNRTFREEVQYFPISQQKFLAEQELIKIMGNEGGAQLAKERNWPTMSIVEMCALVDEVRSSPQGQQYNRTNSNTSEHADLTSSSNSPNAAGGSRSSAGNVSTGQSARPKKQNAAAVPRKRPDLGQSPDFLPIVVPGSTLPEPPSADENDPVKNTVDQIEDSVLIGEQAILPKSVRSESDMDTACKIIKQNMCASRDFVCARKVEKALLQFYKMRSLSEFRVGNVRHINQIPCLKDLSMKERKVNLYIDIFVEMRNVCTISDLETLLTNLNNHIPPASTTNGESSVNSTVARRQKETFESMYQMGPLYKNPMVYEKFKFPTDGTVEPKRLNSTEIATLFKEYLVSKNLWGTRELQTSDFLTFLCDKLDVENPWHLGIKIVSLPLLKSMLTRAQRDCRLETERIARELTEQLVADLRVEINGMRDQITASLHINTNTVYAFIEQVKLINTVDLLKKCYDFCKPLLRYASQASIEEQDVRKRRKRFGEVCDCFEQFFDMCKNNPVAEALFEFTLLTNSNIGEFSTISEAIVFVLDSQALWLDVVQFCPKGIGCEQYFTSEINGNQMVVDLVSEDDESDDDSGDLRVTLKAEPVQDGKSEELESYLLALLSEAEGIANGQSKSAGITLEQLEAIEAKLTKESKFTKTLKKCSMLKFITSTEKLLEPFSKRIGNVTTDEAQNVFENENILTLEKLKNFVYMCEAESSTSEIFDSLKRSYGFEDSLDDQIRSQVEDLLKENVDDEALVQIPFVGSYACSVDLSSSILELNEVRNIALSKISDLAYLKCVATELNWNSDFRPSLGKLDQFLKANTALFQTKFESFIHLNESQIVKIPNNSTFESCNNYVEKRESRDFAAGLVALIISSGGVKSFPFQLSQSEFHGSFNTLYQRNQLIEFLSSSICLLPLCFVPPIYCKIFKPLAEKVGVCDLEEKILMHILNEPEQGNLLTLGMIGNVIGEKQWTHAMMQASSRNLEDNDDLSQQDFDHLGNKSKSSFEINLSSDVQLSNHYERTSESLNSEVLSDAEIALTEKSEQEVVDVLSRETECKLIIDEILSQEFGEGIEVSKEAQALLDKHQERTGRSLERLSKELYSQDVHFILELIQNADDNNYNCLTSQIAEDSTKNTVPTLIFVLESDKLRVFNNERGFESDNIRALCDIGKTTKGKHRKGLIGQKGIGFKSVFRVTDRPEIHSNGFHICFDAHNGALGMIKPQWLDKEEREVSLFDSNLSSALKDDLETEFSTQIVLPFSGDSSKLQTFTAKLKQIEPSLLLFLNNLQKIKICLSIEETNDTVTDEQSKVLSIEKRMLSDKVVSIQSTNVCQFFLLETFSIPVPEHLNLKLEETEICFAFPLEKSATSKSFSFNYHQTQNAFAFLPVRDFGLKFIVQADFEIPSSRQDLDLDSAFNQWISVQLPQLFLQNLKSFEEILKDSVHAAIAFLNFLPLPNETFGFFKPVAQKICELIKNSPVIPTVDGQLCLPAEAINCGEKLLSTSGKFIDTELFTKATGWKLAHKDFDLLRTSVVKQLGLHTVGISDLLVTLEYFCTSESINCDESEKLNTVRNILTAITSNFNHQLNAANLENLKKIAFIPLANGNWVSAKENFDLFCNSDKNQVVLKKLNLLKIVDQQLLTDEGKTVMDIQKLLVRIGVRGANLRELVKYHVVEVLMNKDSWSQLSQESISDYTAFLISSWTDVLANTEQQKINNLLSNFPVLVRKDDAVEIINSFDIGSKVSVYFPAVYKPKIVLASVFPSTKFCVLSDCYLRSSVIQNQQIFQKQAYDFFSRIRVAEFFQFRETQSELLDSDENPEICRDFTSELVDILNNKSGMVSRTEYIQLFTLVSHFWPEITSYLFARVSDGKLGAVKLVKSSVAIAFLESSWIPARIDNNIDLAKPNEVYVNTQETRNIFKSSDVKILDSKIQIETISAEFIKFLGINVALTTEIVLNYLRDCSQDPSFKSNLDHLAHVYQFLQHRLTECSLALQQEPLIYLPNPTVVGEFGFYTVDNLIMDDPSGLFEKYKQTLNKHKGAKSVDVTMFKTLRSYKFLASFFDSIGALSEPSPKHYYQLMMTLISAIDMTRKNAVSSRENRVEDLFRLISLSATEIQPYDACIPCSNNTLASISDDNILLPDDSSTILYAMFEHHQDLKIVHNFILEIAEDIREKVMEILTGTYTLLAGAIEENIVPGQLWTCSTVHKFVYFVCPLVQRYLRKNLREKYEKSKDSLANTLKSLKIFACKEIEVIYTYKNLIAEKSTKFIFCNGKEFYIGREYLEDWNLISKELSTLFSFGERDNYLALFIDGLVKYFNKEPGCHNVESFLSRFGIPLVPAYDAKWSVSEPIYSQMAIDLEIRKNEGDDTVIEEDLKSKEYTQESDTKPKSRGPGQWPPLPPRGYVSGRESTEPTSENAKGASSSKELPPPPPRPNYNWNSEYVVPPRLAAVEPNRVLGETASGSPDNANKGQSAVNIKNEPGIAPIINIAKEAQDDSSNRGETGTSSAPVLVRGEKRALNSAGTNQQPPNFLSSSPQGSTEKKRRSDEPEQNNQFSASSSNEVTGGHSAINDQTESRETAPPISSNINMQVTLPDGNTSFASSVTCQLESLDLSSANRRAPTEEELNKLLPPTGSTGANVDTRALLTGRFGEQLVYEQLCNKWINSNSTEVEIAWLNEKGEQYKPYDICITYKNSNKTDFIEVKSTSSPHCEFFNISATELKFATEQGASYFIFFVFNALESNASVTYFSNLRNKLDSNQVSLLLQLHK